MSGVGGWTEEHSGCDIDCDLIKALAYKKNRRKHAGSGGGESGNHSKFVGCKWGGGINVSFVLRTYTCISH